MMTWASASSTEESKKHPLANSLVLSKTILMLWLLGFRCKYSSFDVSGMWCYGYVMNLKPSY